MPRRRTVLRVSLKFYVFLGILAAAVIAVVFFITHINTATVENGEIVFEQAFPMVVVRDEQIVQAENYGKANYLVREGARVEVERPVAEVYKWGYNDNVMNEYIEKQKTIEDYQKNILLQDGDDPQLTAYDESIAQKATEVNAIISSGTGDILLAESELKELMNQKQEYMQETVEPDRVLSDYYNDKTQIEERIESWRDIKTAPQAGQVSFYFDGAENTLNAENLQQITSASIEDILNGTVQQSSGTSESDETMDRPLYRLVNSYKWYLLMETNEPMTEFSNGTRFDIAFDQYTARQYEATVAGSIVEEGTYIYVIEILDDIGELLNTRRADANVFRKFEGLKVPVSAIENVDGVDGVTVVVNREKQFVPVNVLISRDGSAIIEPVDANSALAAGQEVEV